VGGRRASGGSTYLRTTPLTVLVSFTRWAVREKLGCSFGGGGGEVEFSPRDSWWESLLLLWRDLPSSLSMSFLGGGFSRVRSRAAEEVSRSSLRRSRSRLV